MGDLTSIRLTVFLLLILAGVAVIGTVVPQDQPPGRYFGRYGEAWGGLLRLGVGPRLFQPLVSGAHRPAGVKYLACVVHGLPRAVKRALQPLTGEAALALPERGRITWPPGLIPTPGQAPLRELGRCRQETLADQEIFLERGRFRPVGPYLVHVAILFILAGGLIGKFWGVEGSCPSTRARWPGTSWWGHARTPKLPGTPG